MKQSDAVVEAISSVFGQFDGALPETGKWTEEQRQQVYSALMTSFKEGKWSKNSGGTTDTDLMKYIPGLVNNHVRKDKRLNGGVKYVAKNPGSRTGSGDPAIKAMRQLLAQTDDLAGKRAIQAEIDKRLAELNPKPEIDTTALPESLRHLIPS